MPNESVHKKECNGMHFLLHRYDFLSPQESAGKVRKTVPPKMIVFALAEINNKIKNSNFFLDKRYQQKTQTKGHTFFSSVVLMTRQKNKWNVKNVLKCGDALNVVTKRVFVLSYQECCNRDFFLALVRTGPGQNRGLIRQLFPKLLHWAATSRRSRAMPGRCWPSCCCCWRWWW